MSSETSTKETTGDSSSTEIFPDETKDEVRDVSKHAIWSSSSFKQGYGIENIVDNNPDTYWQSDGPQPHLINIQFKKKTVIRYVSIYFDYKVDESYTPNKISIRIGNDAQDLKQVEIINLEEPCGWINVELTQNSNYVKVFMIQLAVLGNHQNGRDSHIRLIKAFSPISKQHFHEISIPTVESFQTPELGMFACIR